MAIVRSYRTVTGLQSADNVWQPTHAPCANRFGVDVIFSMNARADRA